MVRKRRYDDPPITVDGHPILPSPGITYLGVRLDKCGHFTVHAEAAAKKAETTAVAVARLMPNVGGPSLLKRRMLMTVAVSRVLYAAPVWAGGSVMTDKAKRALDRVNRLASLRLIRAYRSVSGEAAAFLAASAPTTWWRRNARGCGPALERDCRTRTVRTASRPSENRRLPSGRADCRRIAAERRGPTRSYRRWKGGWELARAVISHST